MEGRGVSREGTVVGREVEEEGSEDRRKVNQVGSAAEEGTVVDKEEGTGDLRRVSRASMAVAVVEERGCGEEDRCRVSRMR